MSKIYSLLERLPKLNEYRMVSNGFGVWISWRTDISPAVANTLSDYGGMLISQGRRQALWFFFSSDVVLALAKLQIWARLNPIPVYIQLIPAKLLLGMKLKVSFALEPSLANQDSIVGDEFEVWVHPKVGAMTRGVPGVSYTKVEKRRGLADLSWLLLQADPRLPYQASLGWFVVLKPLGNPLDKNFQAGWRNLFEDLEAILKRMRLKFLIHEFFLMFPLENLRQLRAWCTEYLSLVDRLKEDDPERYWPCVQAVVDKKGLNFNADLSQKVPLDWNLLMPDFPHMSYRNAFLLGEGFKINDVRFSVDQSNVNDWCNVALFGELVESAGSLVVEMPKKLVQGKNPTCFYCGLRGHLLTECPSRELTEVNPGIWEELATMDFDTIKEGLEKVEAFLAEDEENGVMRLLQGKGRESHLVQALFEISSPVQHRMARTVWRSLGKEYPRALNQLGPQQGDAVWSALEELRNHETVTVDRMLSQAAMRNPRGYHPRTLQGFSALERGDTAKAMAAWKEAETLSNTSFQQAYHVYLQARLLEMEGKYQLAITQYKQVLVVSPRWLDAQYRQGVCLVKMGFAEQAMHFFEDIIYAEPHMFNRVLIDPELERGYLQLLSSLHSPWVEAEARSEEELRNLAELRADVDLWFSKEHPFHVEAHERIEELTKLGEIKNFVAFQRLAQGRADLSRQMQRRIEEENEKLHHTFETQMERIKLIRAEASWFPFPRILVEFNKEFNFCARNLNWAYSQHFQMSDKFRKAQEVATAVEDKITDLEKKLKTLKVVRDSTLFVLILGKTFFWLELIGLVLVLILLPLTVYLGQQAGWEWTTGMAVREKWGLQKQMIFIMSISALAIAALRTALVFDRKKRKLFEQYEQEEAARKRAKR